MAWVGVRDIRFICRGEELLHPRAGRGQQRICYRHYLGELSRKPQAVRQVAPELVDELGPPYRRLWELLEETHGAKKAARVLAGVLAAVEEHGEEIVTHTLEEALRPGAIRLPEHWNLLGLSRHLHVSAVLDPSQIPAPLRSVQVESGCAADYDAWLVGGVQ